MIIEDIASKSMTLLQNVVMSFQKFKTEEIFEIV